MKKIVLISSVGGHLEQLLGLGEIIAQHKVSIITERNDTTRNMVVPSARVYLLPYISRRFFFGFVYSYIECFFVSFKYFFKIKPEVIVTTGAGCTLPICLIGKVFGCKVIFIETFARVKSKTMTGRICYLFADVFVVQWEELLRIYPKAMYLGHIY